METAATWRARTYHHRKRRYRYRRHHGHHHLIFYIEALVRGPRRGMETAGTWRARTYHHLLVSTVLVPPVRYWYRLRTVLVPPRTPCRGGLHTAALALIMRTYHHHRKRRYRYRRHHGLHHLIFYIEALVRGPRRGMETAGTWRARTYHHLLVSTVLVPPVRYWYRLRTVLVPPRTPCRGGLHTAALALIMRTYHHHRKRRYRYRRHHGLHHLIFYIEALVRGPRHAS